MKQFILILSCLLLMAVNSKAQGTDKINYQMLLRDASGNLLENSAIGIQFQVLKATNTGTVVFEETHNTTTNALGVISVKIGAGIAAIGTLTDIDWSDDSYFVSIGIDPLGGTNYTLEGTNKLNTVPLAASTLKSGMAITADYNSLTNKPVTITSGQIELLGFLTLSNNLDLDFLKTAVDLNTSRLFPGFGMTAGTVFEILWSKIGNDVFYENGNVGIGANTNLASNSALLSVEGGILYENLTTYEIEIGAIKYFDPGASPIAINNFYFGNNSGNQTFFESIPDKDIVFANDVNIIARLGIGESMVPSYNFNTNNFVMASATPSINFDDTSNSASFPTADWRIVINDKVALGENYFSINYLTGPSTSNSNFKIMAGAPSEAFNILENGNVGINVETPSTKLEVANTVKALSFVGDVSGMTNVPSGSASTSNAGSTTIGADNDSDSNGAVIFQTKNVNQLSIASDGNVAIGNIIATATLEVDGNLMANDIAAQNLLLSGQILKPITYDTQSGFSININIDDKSIIVLNPTSNSYVSFLTGGVEGQVVTFINANTSTFTFSGGSMLIPGGSAALKQHESITLVKNGSQFYMINLVN